MGSMAETQGASASRRSWLSSACESSVVPRSVRIAVLERAGRIRAIAAGLEALIPLVTE